MPNEPLLPKPTTEIPWAKRPWVLKKRYGLCFLMFMFIIAALLSAAFMFARKGNGEWMQENPS